MIEGKLSKHEETKETGSNSPVMIQEALRLPNISLKGTAENIITSSINS